MSRRHPPHAKSRRTPLPQPIHTPEVVDPLWIAKAAGAVVALGLFCAYLTLCLFFYTGQWQFVLHPSRAVPQTPASLQLPFTPVRFGDDASGQPQLTGWWIPSNPAPSSPANPTVLLLHSQDGSMSNALPAVTALHAANLNVFLFDYRGYGLSAGRHPTQSLMQHDASSALAWLQSTHPSPAGTLVYAQGLAASLAVRLCAQNAGISGLILVDADGDTLSRVQADQRSRIVPISLLFHERFPLADPLHTLHTPKLLLSQTLGPAPEIAQRAADPKLLVELPPNAPLNAQTAAITRFLNLYVLASLP